MSAFLGAAGHAEDRLNVVEGHRPPRRKSVFGGFRSGQKLVGANLKRLRQFSHIFGSSMSASHHPPHSPPRPRRGRVCDVVVSNPNTWASHTGSVTSTRGARGLFDTTSSASAGRHKKVLRQWLPKLKRRKRRMIPFAWSRRIKAEPCS